MAEGSAEVDTREDLAADTRLQLRAVETLAAAGMGFPRLLAETSTAGMLMAAVAPLKAAVPMVAAVPMMTIAGITAAVDITEAVRILDPASVSAFTPLTDMPRRSAIPLDSMMNTASGSIIRVALFLTDIRLDDGF
jgi:hypothetical protein